MIASLELVSAPCFGGKRVTIGPLDQVNFIFGANGSGKTTISRALTDRERYAGTNIIWDPNEIPLAIKVYNRDYVDATLACAGTLPGVFLLGATSQVARKEIDELSGPDGAIASLQKNLLRFKTTLGAPPDKGKLGDIQSAHDKLTEAGWTKRAAMLPDLGPMFEGYNASKARFLTRILETSGEYKTTDTDLAELKRDAASVFDTTAVEVAELPTLAEPIPQDIQGFELLDTEIIGSADVALTALIEELENSDWVSQGRTYFNRALGRCPFCQQNAPHNLADQLREYFDSRFTEQVTSLTRFVAWHDAETEKLRDAMEAVAERSVTQLNSVALTAACASLEATLAANSRELQKKQLSPSIAVKLEPIGECVREVNAAIEAANALIREHNTLVRNRAAERQILIDRCWQHFVRDTIASEVAVFESVLPPLLKAKESLEGKIAETSGKLSVAEARLRELQREVRSSRPIIEDINRTLASVGFESFRLASSPDLPDGYSLIRPGGTPAAESLSEGERTFISFLYFFHQLRGEQDDAKEPNDLVAVIDDPISSLDSDILFVVSTLTKRLIAGIRSEAHRVRQLVVLTHNRYFHKEVTYVRRDESEGGRRYFVLSKQPGQPSKFIVHTDGNPIKTAYRSLWDEVRTAKQDPSHSPITLQNVMRRILENYFKVMGDIPDEEILAAFSGGDQAICRSLFSWVNDGSHTIIDELDYSPTGMSAGNFLTIFEAIFSKAGHQAHYNMMMREADRLASR